MRLLWDSGYGAYRAGRNAQKRALGHGRQHVKTRKAAQRIQRARGGRPVKPYRSGRSS